MNADKQPSDALDKLLASQPVQPNEDFTERTLARIRQEVDSPMDPEAQLETWLTQMPVTPSEDFTQRTLEAVRESTQEQPERRILGMPVWVATLGGMAAALAIGAMAFITLFQYAYQQRQIAAVTPEAAPTAVVQDTTPISQAADTAIMVADVTTTESEVVTDTEPAIPLEQIQAESAVGILLLAENDTPEAGYADVLILQDAFAEIDVLSDADTMETLIAFVN